MEFKHKHKSKRQLNRILKRNVDSVIEVCQIESEIVNISKNSTPTSSRQFFTNNRNISDSSETNFEVTEISNADSSGSTFLNDNINVDITKPNGFESDNSENCFSTQGSNNFDSYNEMETGSDLYSDSDLDGINADLNNYDSANDNNPLVNNENKICFDNTPEMFLAGWAMENNVSHRALSQLLGWFNTNPDISNLPRDARTILKTPRLSKVETMGNGLFYYFGIRQGLEKLLLKYNYSDKLGKFFLVFNIDGLPVHKSSKKTFWPILCKVYSNVPLDDALFCVAIYYGPGKPPVEEYFESFVRELNTCLSEGLKSRSGDNQDIHIEIELLAFCCDTPARAFIKCIVGHNHYNGCDRCCVKGIYVERRMAYLDTKAALRTDVSFSNHQDEQHHKGVTPLANITNLGLVTSFPLDYMHSVCLGVMKKLILLWRDGSRLFRLTPEKKLILDDRMNEINKKFWPSDFNRKPRSISEVEYWKAKEYRQFLLYIAPVVLHDLLPKHVYCNFLLLKFGIMILLSSFLNKEYNSYAKDLLHLFVRHTQQIYGNQFCIYNVHTLIHLADDARHFSSLENINCFPFENYLYQLKRMLRKSNEPLQQVIHRLTERDNIMSRDTNNTMTYLGGKPTVEEMNRKVYPRLKFKGFTISSKFADSCIYHRDGIMRIRKIYQQEKDIFLVGTEYQKLGSFLEYPTDSGIFYIFVVQLCEETITISVNDVLYKGVILPFKDNYVCHPLLHQLY